MKKVMYKTSCPYCYGIKTSKLKKGYKCLRCNTLFYKLNPQDRDEHLRWDADEEMLKNLGLRKRDLL